MGDLEKCAAHAGGYPAYVPELMRILQRAYFTAGGFSEYLRHPKGPLYLRHVEAALHEVAHVSLLWPDAEVDPTALPSTRQIGRVLNRRNDSPRQEAVTLAIEYWILRHWGFVGIDDWLSMIVNLQPRSVTVRRVMHHLKHPVKRRYVVEQAHRTLRLLRRFAKTWR